MRTHSDIGLMTARQQACSRSVRLHKDEIRINTMENFIVFFSIETRFKV